MRQFFLSRRNTPNSCEFGYPQLPRLRFRTCAALGCLVGVVSLAVVSAGEWPQILGPHRNGVADGERIQPWDARGPRMLWTYPLGEGYAGPAVLGDRVVVFHRVGDVERAEALDPATGRPLWKADFRATYAPGWIRTPARAACL